MNEQSDSVSFLLGDDHNIVRQGIQLVIENNFDHAVILHAASLQQVMRQVKETKIDIAVLDAQFPDGNCISIIPEIKKQSPTCKILVFSSFDEATYAHKFIEAGADGFLSKLSNETEIKEAIIEIYETGTVISPLTQKILAIKEYNPALLDPLGALSERELQIAELYAKGLGNLEIANIVQLKQNTVSTFKKRIFEKLNITTLVELIELMKSRLNL